MADQLQTLADVMPALLSSDVRTRMQGIIALSKRTDATMDAVMRVGRLLHDEAEFDPSSSSPGPIFIPKWVPTMQACARFFLPYIAKASPRAILEVVQSLPSMSADDRTVGIEILGRIGVSTLAKILLVLDEDELGRVCSGLREQAISEIRPLLDSFSTPSGERAQRVISCLASEGRETLASFPEALSDVGGKAIPFLSELIRFNAANPHPLGFAWQVGLGRVFSCGTVKYLTALEAISVLRRIGTQSKSALSESARSPIAKIRSASKRALQSVGGNL